MNFEFHMLCISEIVDLFEQFDRNIMFEIHSNRYTEFFLLNVV